MTGQFDGTTYQQMLGVELRRLRKLRGWTRKQLNDHLQSDISLQTLATYELGTRQCSVVRLAEICQALGVQPHDVLAKVDRDLFTASSGEIQVDLAEIAGTTEPELLPLRRWAQDRLSRDSAPGSREIRLNLQAIERMAELCGMATTDLTADLRALSRATITADGSAVS